MSEPPLVFKYEFIVEGGKPREFEIRLDPVSLEVLNRHAGPYPDWTALSFCKCPNCPLDEQDHERCPAAVSLVDVLEPFRDSVSYTDSHVYVKTESRDSTRHVSLQEGLSSIVGLCMAASGCPRLVKLRPMVRFHLPFATERETLYRAVTMYLLAQYFRQKRGKHADWELTDLQKTYKDISLVNRHFVARLRHILGSDASVNALIRLDCFAVSVGFDVDQMLSDDFEHFFEAYL